MLRKHCPGPSGRDCGLTHLEALRGTDPTHQCWPCPSSAPWPLYAQSRTMVT